MKSNLTKIKKSASTAHFNIQFNPSQFKCGSSKINKLSDKRPHSSKPQKSKTTLEKEPQKRINKQSQEYELDLVKRMNESLISQNKLLKKQLQYYNKQNTSSRRSSFAVKNEEDYKQKIFNRINGSRVSIKTDNQSTGFLNSKVTTARVGEENISQLYDNYCNKFKPTLEKIYQVTKGYFYEFKENYIKLKCMFDSIKSEKQSILINKIEELLKLFEVPIIFKDKPSLLPKSLSKDKFKKSKGKRIETQVPNSEQFYAQLTSPSETLVMFQNLLKIISKSPKMMEKLTKNKTYLNFDKRIKMI